MAGPEYTRGPRPDRRPEVVVVGAASRDVARDDPRGWRLGGGVTYCALTLARLGIRSAALVGVDGPAAEASELDLLREAGAAVRLVPLAHGPVFENVERPSGRVQTCLDPGSPLPVAALPASWRQASWWLLAPVAGELPPAWAAVPPATAHVVVGWQGLLRVLRAGRHVERLGPRPSPFLERAGLVGVSRHDLDHHLALATVLAPLAAGSELLMTAGDAGGLLLEVGSAVAPEVGQGRRPAIGGRAVAVRRYPALRSPREVDPTGAGDTFLAALVAARIAAATADVRCSPGQDLRLAAAAASLVVEDVGLLGVPDPRALACRLAKGS
ncbi:MAG TPA: PfkB family carbohydrate kinase [Candidatus Limnocylindrales bacterium]|nr:PfkB family carbohydrate kinase [Candidatus Limnocylindrales bacterium]